MVVEEEDHNALILSTLLLEDLYVHILFDPGVTNSFVALEVAFKSSYL